MKVGNLSQTVWRRDIKKKIQARRKNTFSAFSRGKCVYAERGFSKRGTDLRMGAGGCRRRTYKDGGICDPSRGR